MALSDTHITSILLGVATASLLVALLRLSPASLKDGTFRLTFDVFPNSNASAGSVGHSNATGSTPITTKPPAATITRATNTTTATTVVPVACNSAYQAIAGHSICIADSKWLLSSGISASNKQLIVDKHNAYRRNPYPKNATMKGSAMRKLTGVGRQHRRRCPLPNDHESTNSRRSVIGYNVVVGQNLAWGHSTWTQAMSDWFNEYKVFTYGLGAANGTETGHYTQMVYDDTTAIGCGFAECDTGFAYHYVCNYATIQYAHKMKTPFAVGTACASCANKCSNSLCDCNGLICSVGTINLNTCTCA